MSRAQRVAWPEPTLHHRSVVGACMLPPGFVWIVPYCVEVGMDVYIGSCEFIMDSGNSIDLCGFVWVVCHFGSRHACGVGLRARGTQNYQDDALHSR